MSNRNCPPVYTRRSVQVSEKPPYLYIKFDLHGTANIAYIACKCISTTDVYITHVGIIYSYISIILPMVQLSIIVETPCWLLFSICMCIHNNINIYACEFFQPWATLKQLASCVYRKKKIKVINHVTKNRKTRISILFSFIYIYIFFLTNRWYLHLRLCEYICWSGNLLMDAILRGFFGT